jgi:hypothetical protein
MYGIYDSMRMGVAALCLDSRMRVNKIIHPYCMHAADFAAQARRP